VTKIISPLTYFCTAYFPLFTLYLRDKFELCSSKDIGVHILKTWASSAILDWIFCGFDNSAAFLELQSIILSNLNVICQRAAELDRCYRFSNCLTLGAPIGQMDLRVGGPTCKRYAANDSSVIGAIHIVLNFWFFGHIFKSARLEYELGRKTGQNFAFVPPVQIGNGWWRCLYELFESHIGFKHRYTFYTAAIGGLVTQWTVG